MSASPLVTVIIPSFNHGRYIRKAISSVIEQTYSNWELIVVDDGSTDDTPEVLSEFDQDPRIHIICNSANRGQSAVVNQALALAKGYFVSFLPSDDWILPEKLERQVRKFEALAPDFGVVYGRGSRYFEDTGSIVEMDAPRHSGWVLKDLIERNFVYPITPLFRRDCFRRYPFDESYRAEGEAIYLKLAISYQFAFVEDVVGVMRDHSSNTGKNTAMMLTDNLRYWEEFFSRDDIPDDVRRLRSWRIGRLLRLKGMEFVNIRREPLEGRRLLLKSIATWPRGLFDAKAMVTLLFSFLPVAWVARMNALRRGR